MDGKEKQPAPLDVGFVLLGFVVGVVGLVLLAFTVGGLAALGVALCLCGNNLHREARWWRVRKVFADVDAQTERLKKLNALRERGQL